MSEETSVLSIESYARVSAELAESDATLGEVLARHAIDRETWMRTQVAWNRAFMIEAERDESNLADQFAAAHTAAQDALRPIVELTVEQWAALSHAVASEGPKALEASRLSTPDYLRLSRHWAKLLAGRKHHSKAFNDAYFALTRRG